MREESHALSQAMVPAGGGDRLSLPEPAPRPAARACPLGYGTILAGSACQNAVVTALLVLGHWHALRQQLREFLYDGSDKAAPCQSAIDVSGCFGPLIDWVMSWWQGNELALAIDPTSHHPIVVALTVSVLYRGCAFLVAWQILPANQEGAWMSHILRLLRLIHRALPKHLHVLVMYDRGLWSPRLWKRIRDLGWHPLPRLQLSTTCQPIGQSRQVARDLVSGPGHAWVGAATVFRARLKQRTGTLLVVWGPDEKEPWVLLTDLAPDKVGVWWYSLRVWVELGFRALKGVGWQWQNTRRTNPTPGGAALAGVGGGDALGDGLRHSGRGRRVARHRTGQPAPSPETVAEAQARSDQAPGQRLPARAELAA